MITDSCDRARRCGSNARNVCALEVRREPAQLRNSRSHSRGWRIASKTHCEPDASVWLDEMKRDPSHPTLNGDAPSPQQPKFDCSGKTVSTKANQFLHTDSSSSAPASAIHDAARFLSHSALLELLAVESETTRYGSTTCSQLFPPLSTIKGRRFGAITLQN